MKKLVNLYLIEENGHKGLAIRDKRGREQIIEIFNGGGYYTDFLIRTPKEIEADRLARIKEDIEEDDRIFTRLVEKQSKKWWQFWK